MISRRRISRLLRKEGSSLFQRVSDIVIGLIVTAIILWLVGKLVDSEPAQRGWRGVAQKFSFWANGKRVTAVSRLQKIT